MRHPPPFKLTKDALGHKVKDVSETARLVGWAGEVWDKIRNMFHHGVVVRRIITRNTENLTIQGKFLSFSVELYAYLIFDSKLIKYVHERFSKVDAGMRPGDLNKVQ